MASSLPPHPLIERVERSVRDPELYQTELLRKILMLNSGSRQLKRELRRLGQNFDAMNEEFIFSKDGPKKILASLPLSTYDAYRDICDRLYKEGEVNEDPTLEFRDINKELSGSDVVAFFTSSGTTGAIKRLPCVKVLRSAWNEFFVTKTTMMNMIYPPKEGDLVLKLGWVQEIQKLKNCVLVGPMTAVGFAAEVKFRTEGRKDLHSVSAPTAWPQPATAPLAYMAQNAAQAGYAHWVCALSHADEVTRISDGFAVGVLNNTSYLLNNFSNLIDDVEAGFVDPSHMFMPDHIKADVERQMDGPKPELAARLKAAWKSCPKGPNGVPKGIFKALFPRLQFVEAITTGHMAKYIARLRELVGEGIPIISGMFVASEGNFAMSWDEIIDPEMRQRRYIDDSEPHEFMLFPDNGAVYIELLPVEVEGGGEPTTEHLIPMHQAKVGSIYEIIITSVQGFFRYRMGDIVQVQRFYHKTPVVTVVGRSGAALNLMWEKTRESMVMKVVETVAAEYVPGGITSVVDYTTQENISTSPGHYDFFLEVTEEATKKDFDLGDAVMRIEVELAKVNVLYGLLRSKSHGGPAALHLLKPGTFNEIRRAACSRGTSNNQFKLPVVLKPNPVFEAILFENIIRSAQSQLTESDFHGTTDETI